ncbi:MAG: 30S ribosomal protein S17 [Candidatus Kapaibacteriales bacterium]
MSEQQKSRKRTVVGKVTSNKADKTISVTTVRQVKHPIYKKYFKLSSKAICHDENNECNEGDTVRIVEHRPLSKRKRWNLVEVIERAK